MNLLTASTIGGGRTGMDVASRHSFKMPWFDVLGHVALERVLARRDWRTQAL